MFGPDSRILIVDDQPPLRGLLRSQLRALKMGANPENHKEANDGVEGFAKLEQAHLVKLPIDLIISDWEMPNMSGLDFLKKVRADERFKATPFLLLTAKNQADNVLKAMESGASNYMLKPFSIAVLKDKLERVWQTHHGKAK
jgi:two-component system chemotaxis response regulator CheY